MVLVGSSAWATLAGPPWRRRSVDPHELPTLDGVLFGVDRGALGYLDHGPVLDGEDELADELGAGRLALYGEDYFVEWVTGPEADLLRHEHFGETEW